jgi:hypothetical protein
MVRAALTCAALMSAIVYSLPAHATGTLTRTFVSSTGVDSNPCTTAAPCATFAAAYAAVAPNGIVAALDPGKYGPINITTAVTIDGNGWAAITAPSGGRGIQIQAGASDNVILRGITIDGGAGGAYSGILFTMGASLTIVGCAVRNMDGGDGLDVGSNSSSTVTLTVEDSQFIDSGSSPPNNGVSVQANSSGAIKASFVRTAFTGDDIGLLVASDNNAPIDVAVTDSVIANNVIGVQAVGGSTVPANVVLSSDQISGNRAGIVSTGNSGVVWLAQSTVAGNSVNGFQATSNGIIYSFGNNYFANNGANSGSLTGTSTQ